MLRLHNTAKIFVSYLMNYKELSIETVLDTADKTLSFTYLSPGVLHNEYYIETDEDRYVVKELHPGPDGTEAICQLDLEALEADVFDKFTAENKTIQEMANTALAGTGWRASVETAIADKVRSVQTFNARPRQVLEKIRDAFMCEFYYDNISMIVYFVEERGDYKGAYLRRGLNLSKLNTTMDSYDYYTRILPIGKDGLRIGSVNAGSDYLTNFQYSNKVRTYVWEDTSYERAADLKEDAIRKLDDLSKPKVSYSVEVRDLAKMSDQYSLLSYSIGDTVDIVDSTSGVRDCQRIVKIKEYPNDPTRNTCELSNTVLTFEEWQERLRRASEAWEDATNSDGTIKGIYVHGVQAEDVVYIEVQEGDPGEDPKIVETTAQAAIDGVVTRVGTIETTYLKAAQADLRYANISLANVDTANIKNMYVRSGLIKTLHVEEEEVDFLDAVEIEADKITAGSLIADRILLRTQDGLLYALNNMGSSPSANTDTLDGQIITPASIKAVKIDVEDLFAQNITATGKITGMTIAGTKGEIGGWGILEKCLYSETEYETNKITTVLQNADIDISYTLTKIGTNGLLVEQWYTEADELIVYLSGIQAGYSIEITGSYLYGDATLTTEATSLVIDTEPYASTAYSDIYYSEAEDQYYDAYFGEIYVLSSLLYYDEPTYYCAASDTYLINGRGYYIYDPDHSEEVISDGPWVPVERSKEEAEIYAGLPEGATLSPAGAYSHVVTVRNDIDSADITMKLTLPSAAAGEMYQFLVNVYDENDDPASAVDFDMTTGGGTKEYSDIVKGLPKTAVLAIKREEAGDIDMLWYVDKAGDMNAQHIYEGGVALEQKYVQESDYETIVLDGSAINTGFTNTGHVLSARICKFKRMVTMTGVMKTGSALNAAAFAAMFRIPSGYKPLCQIFFSAYKSGGTQAVTFYMDPVDNDWVRLLTANSVSPSTEYSFTVSYAM